MERAAVVAATAAAAVVVAYVHRFAFIYLMCVRCAMANSAHWCTDYVYPIHDIYDRIAFDAAASISFTPMLSTL